MMTANTRKKCRPFSYYRLARRRKKHITIKPSGWANTEQAVVLNESKILIPYSSHSNFQEIEQFVASVRPAVLKCVVNFHKDTFDKVGNIKYFHQYSYNL